MIMYSHCMFMYDYPDWDFSVLFPQLYGKRQGKTRKDGARPALFLIFVLFYVFCVVLCIVCFVSFSVLFVCICVLNYCHWVATQLQLNISYHIFSRRKGRAVGWIILYCAMPSLEGWALGIMTESRTEVHRSQACFCFCVYRHSKWIVRELWPLEQTSNTDISILWHQISVVYDKNICILKEWLRCYQE